ncbi:cation:proton antiporter [Alienimonas californiensis]|uniref:Glutathione-regulated potassium-efflux system protein KefC n=1 Tax=Alienimonas californiensis TaxID=2527989 RepID=A0A517PCQ5_9PLAN|nr:cation:proton antiporter [Alienimonas californiensis]QDT17164.1 Glutathione-regulated potassium-efflux system protein KefC [Alienimonas californiensis]
MDLWLLLRDIVVLLAGSLLVGGIFARFGQSPIVGYLLAGMLLGGPGSVGAVTSQHEIEAVAELGVALLLFSLGLEFSVARLRKLGPKPLLGGAVQVVVTVLVTAAAAYAFSPSVAAAVAFGAMVAPSSTAVVLRILMERGQIDMPHGRNSLGVLLTQDMAVVPLALLMTVLGAGGSLREIGEEVGRLFLVAGGLTATLYVLTSVAVWALGQLTLRQNRELTVGFAAVAGLGAAWISHAAGISPALGAFVAGMMLGSSDFATQIRADISPLQVILLTLFFGSAGMVADPIWILSNWYVVAAVVAALTVGKLAIVWAIFRAFGQTNRTAAATGLALAQVGEFAFVLGSVGRSGGVVSAEMYSLVVSAAIVSFFASAFLAPAAPQFGNFVAGLLGDRSPDFDASADEPLPPEVAIIGFGPAGRIAAGPLIDRGVRTTVLDLNQHSVWDARRLGFAADLGDATQAEVFDHAGLHNCEAVVITIPHHTDALMIIQRVRAAAPQAHIIVRSRYQVHEDAFTAAGVDSIAGDEKAVGQRLAVHLRLWMRKRNARRSAAAAEPEPPTGDIEPGAVSLDP